MHTVTQKMASVVAARRSFALAVLIVAVSVFANAASTAGPTTEECAPTACMVNLTRQCPPELRVPSTAAAGTVACKSAWKAFGSAAQLCWNCSGEYSYRADNSVNKGEPSSAYSELLKRACPRAYTDGGLAAASANYTCAGGEKTCCTYTIAFCQSTTSSGQPSSTNPNSQAPPLIDGSATPTSYTGGSKLFSGPWRIAIVVAVLGAVTAALGVLAKLLGLFKLCFT